MTSILSRTLAIAIALTSLTTLPACQGASPTQTQTAGTVAGQGQGTIKGVVTADGLQASAMRVLLQAKPGKGGKVKCTSSIDTKEVDVAEDGSFSVVVKGGAEYTVEATVPDGKGGTYKTVKTGVNVPLAQDPQVADIGSLVTRQTGSLQGLIQLVNAKTGDTPEGADVFLSGGTSVVGKAGATGRFSLTGVAEGTWNVVVMKPGYGRKVIQGLVVRAGRPTLIDEAVVLDRDASEAKAGIRGVVRDSNGSAVVGATVSAFPKDRAMLAGSDAGLNNFTAISDDQGNFEMLNLPPGDYQVQVYRPFYQLPPRQDVKVEANATADLGAIKLTSTVAYFGKVSGQILDASGQPLDGAVIQLDPPVTDSQFSDAAGHFTLDRIMPGEYTMSVSAAGFETFSRELRVENQQNFNLAMGEVAKLAPRGASPAPSAPKAPKVVASKEYTVIATDGSWQDAGVAVQAGQTLTISCTGQFRPCAEGCWATAPGGAGYGPEGALPGGPMAPTPAEDVHDLGGGMGAPAPQLRSMAVIGRIGDGAPFFVGKNTSFVANASGPLRLVINDWAFSDNEGDIAASIQVSE